MEEKNKPGETVPEPGESERISAERKAALQDIDRKREEKEKLRQTQKQEAVKVHGSLSAYMNWPLLVCISLLILWKLSVDSRKQRTQVFMCIVI